MEEYIVNLDMPPSERWHFLTAYKSEINDLLKFYLNDFEDVHFIFEHIETYKDILPRFYLEEIEFIASISKFSAKEVLIANLYYDILKLYFGCSAFALNTGNSILHARNLDWHTDDNLLSKHSMILDFRRGGQTHYKTVGWPGFVGALSGTKPGKFSVTLNAILSNDQPELAYPISFLLRDALESASNFSEAKKLLEKTPIISDCLLLLSGTRKNELIVIERTPKRSAIRTANNNHIAVTNDYKLLENTIGESILQSTSCGRYDNMMRLIEETTPQTTAACLDILKDPQVMMTITMQQMCFDNKSGKVHLIKPGFNAV